MDVNEFEERFATGEVDISPNELAVDESIEGIEIKLGKVPIVSVVAQLEHIIHQEISIPIATTPVFLTITMDDDDTDNDTYLIGEVKYTIDKHRAITNLFRMYNIEISYIKNGGTERKPITYNELFHTVTFHNLNNYTHII